MTKHRTGTRKEWPAARLELLEAEKELTRRSDELARRRQELPWVRIDKEYRFETDERNVTRPATSPSWLENSSVHPHARPHQIVVLGNRTRHT